MLYGLSEHLTHKYVGINRKNISFAHLLSTICWYVWNASASAHTLLYRYIVHNMHYLYTLYIDNRYTCLQPKVPDTYAYLPLFEDWDLPFNYALTHSWAFLGLSNISVQYFATIWYHGANLTVVDQMWPVSWGHVIRYDLSVRLQRRRAHLEHILERQWEKALRQSQRLESLEVCCIGWTNVAEVLCWFKWSFESYSSFGGTFLCHPVRPLSGQIIRPDNLLSGLSGIGPDSKIHYPVHP